MRRSEVLAEESAVCLQKALIHLQEIWELIGIPEEQRLQRSELVKMHIKDLLDRMIAEEESLRKRLLKKQIHLSEGAEYPAQLQIPEEEREPVAAIMAGSKAKVRNALQLEVDGLEELKMQNLKQVTETSRVELAQFWDQCFYSQEQRQGFAPYFTEDYTENLLHLHDAEIIRLRNYYGIHKELFEGVQKWEESWKLFLEFERKASDPSWFTNRGGNLLKEEKERAKLQKILPKLEEELKARIEKWEQEQSMAFVMNGQKFMEYVAGQWELHRLEKERTKQERQIKNQRQTETEMLYGSAPRTPSKRPGLTPNKPGKVRKMNTTTLSSATPNSSIRPAFGGTMYHSPVSLLSPSGSKSVVTSMCSGKKTPRAAYLRANKENMELNGAC
ncbi:protein regulator of cytokinesis 1 isoform 2 [Cricetulus griseus]|uniref:Protein regulator of cytokinesis 1 isoform 2 n=1 Tax=Cricetulus griseus TaxID=10029 RepID=A0A061I7U2_CRIGR|nr:protein regulator of cytokinesis 1 isoform 2 [Cricetulus griseus]